MAEKPEGIYMVKLSLDNLAVKFLPLKVITKHLSAVLTGKGYERPLKKEVFASTILGDRGFIAARNPLA